VKKLYSDHFDSFDNYWVEGGEAAWVADNRLYQKANPDEGTVEGSVSTIWCRTPFPADVEIRMKARVVASEVEANNINLFLSYAVREGATLEETRDERADGDYAHYHGLDGYIFTFLRDWQFTGETEGADLPARFRIRRCPGFQLLAEKHEGFCEQRKVYDLRIRKQGGELSIGVDGQVILEAIDPSPLGGGFFGFRTFRTELWWSELEVWAL
jgi:hypothetical protein